MKDATTKQPLRVTTAGTAGPVIHLAESQLNDVRQLMDRHGIRYWVDEFAISFDGSPEETIIYLGRNVDPVQVQRLLDGIP